MLAMIIIGRLIVCLILVGGGLLFGLHFGKELGMSVIGYMLEKGYLKEEVLSSGEAELASAPWYVKVFAEL